MFSTSCKDSRMWRRRLDEAGEDSGACTNQKLIESGLHAARLQRIDALTPGGNAIVAHACQFLFLDVCLLADDSTPSSGTHEPRTRTSRRFPASREYTVSSQGRVRRQVEILSHAEGNAELVDGPRWSEYPRSRPASRKRNGFIPSSLEKDEFLGADSRRGQALWGEGAGRTRESVCSVRWEDEGIGVPTEKGESPRGVFGEIGRRTKNWLTKRII